MPTLPTAGPADRLLFVAEVAAPLLAKGPLLRRPRVERLIGRLDLERRAVRRLAALRDRYGDLVLVPLPGRVHAAALTPEAAARVLDGTPDPFSPATLEKRRALSHFEPLTSLASTGEAREARRRFHDAVLEPGEPVHALAAPLLATVEEEAGRLLAEAGATLDWDRFLPAWDAMARRLLFGGAARDDRGLTDTLFRLRARANWVVAPRRPDLLADLRGRVEAHLARAEPGSLAHRAARAPLDAEPHARADQVAQHIFALDTSGMAVIRALALLAAHPEAAARARAEAEAGGAALPTLRAAVLESIRLWPTTPAILREAARDVDWDGRRLPARTSVLVHVPFLHRDDRLPFAHRFAPELWTGAAAPRPFLVPFSAGPGRCPAHHLVPMLGAAWLAAVLRARRPRLRRPALDGARLPATLEQTTLLFDL